ncbi:hypothetical protein ACIQVR_29850 [Streptomyces xanthochromogenes]|uniref:hypothetical protein n=1 Tax=Streptomyces xanthochromogenes TaxID=67384 RepID=UPI003802AF63
MSLTPTFRTVASGCIALSALYLAQAALAGVTPPSITQVRADGPSVVSAPDGTTSRPAAGLNGTDDVTWGS